MEFVSDFEEAAHNIGKYGEDARREPRLRERAGYVRSWFALRTPAGGWLFAPSKFTGYRNSTADSYLAEAGSDGDRDGRQTERLLANWFAQVSPDTPLGRELHEALRVFLASFNQVPNKLARISVPSRDVENRPLRAPAETDLMSRIVADRDICGGRPRIKGTRVRVSDIVEPIAHGASKDELLRDYDYLSEGDIAAALLYAAKMTDHRLVRTA